MSADPFAFNKNTPRDRHLHGKYRHAWTEESLDLETGRWATAHTRRFLGASFTKTRLNIFLGLVALLLLILGSKVFFLQIIRGGEYRKLAEGNRIRIEAVPAERGIIYDRYGVELVHNVPSFYLAIIPQDLPRGAADRAAILEQVASESSTTLPLLEEALHNSALHSYDSLIVKENLDYQTALKLYIAHSDLPGVVVESGSKRLYPYGSATSTTSTPSLSHILGYLGKLSPPELSTLREKGYGPTDAIGKTGVEKSYETALRGTFGRKKIEVDAAGKEQNILAVDPPHPGKDLILSIDFEAQHVLEELVKSSAATTHKERYAAVALDPKTGEILALVSWPTYNNNDFSGGISAAAYKGYLQDSNHPLFNRAMAGLYPPGSTAKLMVAAAALQEGVATTQTTVNSVGGLQVGNRFFKDWKAGGHGITNVVRALAWSVNTYFYYVGGGYEKFTGLGVDRLFKYFSMFKLAERTGIDLPGEPAGFIPTPSWKQATEHERWYVGDTYNISIGQGGLLVAPLTVARWTAAVATNGSLITPHVAKTLVDPDTKISQELGFPTSKITGISAANFAIVRAGMRECVKSGSCQLLNTLPFTAAGKTGTAQWSNSHPTHAWFTSFAPAENPQIVVTVLVEDGGEGSVVAMPIARNFLAWWGKKYLH